LSMKIAKLTKNGMEIVEKEIPVMGSGEVLIKSAACGICEGDVYHYKRVTKSGSNEELFLGHEGTGTIVAMGEGVTGFVEGDMVTTSLGGAYGEYFVTLAERLTKVPEGFSPEHIVGEAVSCCAYSARNARVRNGDRVAVIGCGFMGILIIAFVKKIYGAGEVLAVDPIGWRRELAECYGADRSTSPEDINLQKDYFDVVIEATGVSSALNTAAEMVITQGRLTIVGFHQSEGGQRCVDMKLWNLKALEVTSGHCKRPLWKKDALQKALPYIVSGEIDLKGLVTIYKFDDIDKAFKEIADGRKGLLKASLVF